MAPVHEMLGHVEWKLGVYDQSMRHFDVALEICAEELRRFDKIHGYNEDDNNEGAHNMVAGEVFGIDCALDDVDKKHPGKTKRKNEGKGTPGDEGDKEDVDRLEIADELEKNSKKIAKYIGEGAEEEVVKVASISYESGENGKIHNIKGTGETFALKYRNINTKQEITASDEDSQRELLVTQINRIKMAIDSVKLEVKQKQSTEDSDGCSTKNEKVSNLDDILEVGEETVASTILSPIKNFEHADLAPEKKEEKRQEKLRNAYLSQMEKGEEQYNLKQYELAVAAFNEARFALLMRSGKANTVHYEGLRDQINSALLLERITDCQVQKFFKRPNFRNEMDEGDMSHVNFDGAANMLSEIKQRIKEQLDHHAKARKLGSTQRDGLDVNVDRSPDSFDAEKEDVDTGKCVQCRRRSIMLTCSYVLLFLINFVNLCFV